MLNFVPADRLTVLNDAPVRGGGEYVLYWMIAHRRTRWHFGIQHAVNRAAALGRPLLVFEALRVGYRWASARIHRFVLDGMADNQARCAAAGVTYFGYVEPAEGAGKGLLQALAGRACEVITDEFPSFFVPRMVAAAARALPVRLTQVDSNGVLPLRASEDREFTVAHSFRRHLQKVALPHLEAFPEAEPLAQAATLGKATVPAEVARRWPAFDPGLDLRALPIDHAVGAVADLPGGAVAAEARMRQFVARKLGRYPEDRNEPERDGSSGLSPYLHFGHISAHEVVDAVWRAERWHPGRLAAKPNGKRHGWWGMGEAAEAFLDELITWREVGYAFSHRRPADHTRYESLPDWARATLAEHAEDPREVVYDLDTLAAGRTHDPLWNAAQGELVQTGRMHNYLRMLWGKKVLQWSARPQDALAALIELNNRYALDGRNPNSYSGIFWVFGRFDRAWGPERPIFGKVRYMTSESTARKLSTATYIRRFAPR
ncbi:MAG: deoxyribodipyrimidine photolyase [Myxococcales bacterium]|nr:deoxyribodipyrimidine photolyase [Myxococcales bacterium]